MKLFELTRRALSVTICVALVLVGLAFTTRAVDVTPYIGTPQLDYVGLHHGYPLLPQIIFMTFWMALAGAALAVLNLMNLRQESEAPLSAKGLLMMWLAWAGAASVLVILPVAIFGLATSRSPDPAWIIGAARNVAISASLLTAVHSFVRGQRTPRPARSRMAIFLVWLGSVVAVMLGAFVVLAGAGALPPDHLKQTALEAVIIGLLVSLSASLGGESKKVSAPSP